MHRKCPHGPQDRYKNGKCRLCHLRYTQANKERYDQARREREEGRIVLSVGGNPPEGWLCPLCRTPTDRWICSPRCKSVIIDATLAGVDFRAYQGATP